MKYINSESKTPNKWILYEKSVLGLCEWVEISWTWVVLFSVGPPHGKLFTAITNFKLSTLSKGAKTPSFQKMMKFVKKADSYSCKIFNHESPMSNFFPPHHQPVSPWNLNFPAASRWIIEMETLTPLSIKHRFPAPKMPWLKRVFHIICFGIHLKCVSVALRSIPPIIILSSFWI